MTVVIRGADRDLLRHMKTDRGRNNDVKRESSYLRLARTGELDARAERARELLKDCRLCPRECRVDRLAGETGFCGAGSRPTVASYAPHFGEESPLVGRGGSGTIFLSGCNLGCVFCQNYDISRFGRGSEVEAGRLGEMMLDLQGAGCHNINFVTPTHQVPQILEALVIAVRGGLTVPLVYNSGGYESVETLRLLDGVFDIYMPDMKYGDNDAAELLSEAGDYVERSRTAVLEMHRQVGDLRIDDRGTARRGLIIRHLVLPEGYAGTAQVMAFVAENISTETYVNIMDQYHPCFRAGEYPLLNRRITRDEFKQALRETRNAGLFRLDRLV